MRNSRTMVRPLLALALLSFIAPGGSPASEPELLDDRFRLSLFAEHPDVRTPVGCAVDPTGRVLVVESHTHFRPKGYEGPEQDRILALSDTDGDGRADKFETVYQGGTHIMSLAVGAGGRIYVATRSEIFRLHPIDKPTEAQTLVRLETPGTYPHNGLCGLAVSADLLKLYFGLGENFGQTVPADQPRGPRRRGARRRGARAGTSTATTSGIARSPGSPPASGTPSGSASRAKARCSPSITTPTPARRTACYTSSPTAITATSSATAAPANTRCKPGTASCRGRCPMVAGTGRGRLRHLTRRQRTVGHQLGAQPDRELHADPRPDVLHGEAKKPSCAGIRTSVPSPSPGTGTDRSISPTGVDRSYPLHGKGRVWKLTPKDASMTLPGQFPLPRETPEKSNPFAITKSISAYATLDGDTLSTWENLAEDQRVALVSSFYWKERDESEAILRAALADASPAIQIAATRVVADLGKGGFKDALSEKLPGTLDHAQLFDVTAAALKHLGAGATLDRESLLLAIVEDESRPAPERAAALRRIPPDSKHLTGALFVELGASDDPALRSAAAWHLVHRTKKDAAPLVAKIRAAPEADPAILADIEAVIDDRSAAPAPHPRLTPAQWLVELAGEPGDPRAGRRVFFSDKLGMCARCHTHGGYGRAVGPDLTGFGEDGDLGRLVESIQRTEQRDRTRLRGRDDRKERRRAKRRYPDAGDGSRRQRDRELRGRRRRTLRDPALRNRQPLALGRLADARGPRPEAERPGHARSRRFSQDSLRRAGTSLAPRREAGSDRITRRRGAA